jgi:hypothetical protein
LIPEPRTSVGLDDALSRPGTPVRVPGGKVAL